MQLVDREKANELMRKQNVDLLLASSRPSVGYLSDYWHPVSDDYYMMWAVEATHKTFAGLPSDTFSDPFLVAGASEKTTVDIMDPWIQDRRYWGPGYYVQTWIDPLDPDPDPGDPITVVAEVIRDRGLANSTIAIEMRYLGVRYVEALKSLLPGVTLVDAEEILWSLRMVKCEEERRRLREAGTRNCQAWLDTIRQAETGMTQSELGRIFVKSCMDNELEFERVYPIFGPAGVALTNGSPASGDVRLEEGMFMRVDCHAKFEGYASNMSRVVAHGDVSSEMERVHAMEKKLIDDLMPEFRSGVAVADIRRKELSLYQEIGQPPLIPYTGHGVGRVVHEPPLLALNDPTVLQPGITVTLEPHVIYSGNGDIFLGMEDQVLITESGEEWLTESAPKDLYV
jgi:Xaa-Pro aminopeptidase